MILEQCPTYAQSVNAEIFWIETLKTRGVHLLNKENPHAKSPACAGKPWTPLEDKRLLELCQAETPIKDIAKFYQRTYGAIKSRIRYIDKTGHNL